MAQPDAKTFDLVGVLSGRNFPEHKVTVFFDEGLGFAVHTLRKALDLAVASGDEDLVTKTQKELDTTLEKVKSEMYTFHLRGVPESVRRNIIETINEEFPPKKNLLGQPEIDIKADKELTKKLWAAYIVKVENPEGAVQIMDADTVEILYNQSSRSVHEAINAGIDELTSGAHKGFEAAVQEIDFLSQASPEG